MQKHMHTLGIVPVLDAADGQGTLEYPGIMALLSPTIKSLLFLWRERAYDRCLTNDIYYRSL